MRYIKIISLIITISILYGCSKCDNKPLNQVNIRVENNLNMDLNSILIGGTMYKSNETFASCTLTGGFESIKQGETTEYLTTYGKHAGYDRVRIQFEDEDRQGAGNAATNRKEMFDNELLKNGAFQDSVANVYNGKMEYGLSLPDGDYTYKISSLSENKNVFDIEIVKD